MKTFKAILTALIMLFSAVYAKADNIGSERLYYTVNRSNAKCYKVVKSIFLSKGYKVEKRILLNQAAYTVVFVK